MGETHASIGRPPLARIIGPAVTHGVATGDQPFTGWHRRATGYSYDTAHVAWTGSGAGVAGRAGRTAKT